MHSLNNYHPQSCHPSIVSIILSTISYFFGYLANAFNYSGPVLQTSPIRAQLWADPCVKCWLMCSVFVVWLSQFLGMCTTFSLWMRKWTKYLSNMTSKIQIRQPGPRALTSWLGCHFSASIKNTNTSLLVNPWMEVQEPCKPCFLNSGSGPHTKLKQQSERKIENINTVNPCDIWVFGSRFLKTSYTSSIFWNLWMGAVFLNLWPSDHLPHSQPNYELFCEDWNYKSSIGTF